LLSSFLPIIGPCYTHPVRNCDIFYPMEIVSVYVSKYQQGFNKDDAWALYRYPRFVVSDAILRVTVYGLSIGIE